jgi:hypothetical protein
MVQRIASAIWVSTACIQEGENNETIFSRSWTVCFNIRLLVGDYPNSHACGHPFDARRYFRCTYVV